MTLFKTNITAKSNFATPLQGDTLFGQICWMIRYKEGEEKLEELLEGYDQKPFLVVSDAFAKGYLPKPSLPSNLLAEDPDKKKENRKKIWLTPEELQNGKYTKARTDKEANCSVTTEAIIKNGINYKTFTTGEGFDPYSEEEYSFTSKDIYFLLDESRMNISELEAVVGMIGEVGYGKNTTIGKGRFSIASFEKIDLKKKASTTFMLLSSFTAHDLEVKNFFYEPHTKFGKHGGDLATRSPFKKPLLLAKSGSVVVFEEAKEAQYLGKAIRGHSAHEKTVHQGYAIALPIAEINDAV